MILYLPERIYNHIKDDDQYKLIQSFLETRVKTIKTIEDMFLSEQTLDEMFQQQCNQDSYYTIRRQLVEHYCPMYLEEYDIVTKYLTKQDLIDLYEKNKNTWDDEVCLYCLSNIIAHSYLDHTEFDWYKRYVERYEQSTTLITLSQYVHLKYFRVKTETLIQDIIYDQTYTDKHLVDSYDVIQSIYTAVLPYVSKDFLDNQVFVAFTFLIRQLFIVSMDDDRVMQDIYAFNWNIDNYKHQYFDQCFNYLEFLFTILKYTVTTNNLVKIYDQLQVISKYIDNSLTDLVQLYKGCIQFDLEQQSKYMSIVYAIKFLSMIYPHLDIDIKNLPDDTSDERHQDRTFIMQHKFMLSDYHKALAPKNQNVNTSYMTQIRKFINDYIYVFSLV